MDGKANCILYTALNQYIFDRTFINYFASFHIDKLSPPALLRKT
jgi:hypothetical protein